MSNKRYIVVDGSLSKHCCFTFTIVDSRAGFLSFGLGKTRTTPKVKCNEPCPCGSGIKAKKCKCLKDQAAV
jgi:hypothetical protein